MACVQRINTTLKGHVTDVELSLISAAKSPTLGDMLIEELTEAREDGAGSVRENYLRESSRPIVCGWIKNVHALT